MPNHKNQIITVISLVVVAAFYFVVAFFLKPALNAATPASGSLPPDWGRAARTSGCAEKNSLQDKECTPGDILPNVTKEEICKSGYTSTVRNVPQSVKEDVYAAYGITSHQPGQYEVDHLVSLELGGSNDISNLWPQPAEPKPGCHEKDVVENHLHDQVCAGAMSLEQAQIKISTDWLAVYNSLSK